MSGQQTATSMFGGKFMSGQQFISDNESNMDNVSAAMNICHDLDGNAHLESVLQVNLYNLSR